MVSADPSSFVRSVRAAIPSALRVAAPVRTLAPAASISPAGAVSAAAEMTAAISAMEMS
jgi:hypothetical protein